MPSLRGSSALGSRHKLPPMIPVVLLAVLSLPMAGQRPSRELSFGERVKAQEALERVYYAHQIDARRSFGEAVPRALIEKKVRTYLKQTAALERYWKLRVTDVQLQKEVERMVRATRMPGRLRELFAALGNDPLLIRECLARPILVDRLTRNFYAGDRRFHAATPREAGTLRERRAEGSLDPSEARAGEAIPGQRRTDSLRRDEETGGKSFEEWWRDVEPALNEASVRAAGHEDEDSAPPRIASEAGGGGCLFNESWDNGSLGDPPSEREHHSAVWTGSLMLVFGGQAHDGDTNTGGRYDPATDTWTRTSTLNAPSPRSSHVAVWTGDRMIVWGGSAAGTFQPSGGLYDPLSDTWAAMSAVSAPPAFYQQEYAGWAGGRMVIWNSVTDVGGRYDPSTDTWESLSPSVTLANRDGCSFVSTGTEVIAWGGRTRFTGPVHGTGARYNPLTDTWTSLPTTNAPSPRWQHTAVWSGSEMLVWGGDTNSGLVALGTGARYDPVSDSWTAISTVNAPAVTYHTAAWTGERMVVYQPDLDTLTLPAAGGRYDPATDTWDSMSLVNIDARQVQFTTISTGSQMILWGGFLQGPTVGWPKLTSAGIRYDPAADAWTPTSPAQVPSARVFHTAIWTGNRMVVWGGEESELDVDTGGRYDPVTDTWTPTSTIGAPAPRYRHTVAWTGDRMVVWGGSHYDTVSGTTTLLDSGGRYDPVADVWEPTSQVGAPTPRNYHTAVWTGDRMLIWGGWDDASALNTGARYDPIADTWTDITLTGAPSPRLIHTAVWTGGRMVIWGGSTGSLRLDSGGRYDPASDAWEPTSTVGVPAARSQHTGIWTGNRMVVWGGWNGSAYFNSGGRYDPVSDLWTPTTTSGAPVARAVHAAVWTGDRMLVWGGKAGTDETDTGGLYDPLADNWTPTSDINRPRKRYYPTAVWTGEQAIVWGGYEAFPEQGIVTLLATGGRYCLCPTSAYYHDGDGDGFGDAGAAIQACAAPPGYVSASGDCNDGDGGLWGTPSEVPGLAFTDALNLSWSPPAQGGATAIQYDLIRSSEPDDFVSAATCVASGISSLSAEDAAAPGAGAVLHYLARARNGCPALGPLGNRSDGTPRTALSCP